MFRLTSWLSASPKWGYQKDHTIDIRKK